MVSPIRSFLDFDDIRLMDDAELQRYLTDVSVEEKYQARQLWRQYSRRPDLIDFEQGEKRQYTYDRETMEYYETTGGRKTKLPIASIKMDVNSFANEIQAQQRKLMADMLNGVISPQAWYNESARLMKLSYYAIVTVARGGAGDMDEQENYWWLLLLLAFYFLLNGTAQGIQDGSIKITGRLPVSHGLRGGAVRTIFENWRVQQAKREGYTEARRFLTPAEHCEESDLPGCIEEAEKGWMPIDQLVPLGGCTCRCITNPKHRVLTTRGWVTMDDIVIGDCVLTHRKRWRPVTAKIIKYSNSSHKQVYIHSPSGEWIGATDTHLWFTNHGWKNSLDIYNYGHRLYNIGYENMQSLWREGIKRQAEKFGIDKSTSTCEATQRNKKVIPELSEIYLSDLREGIYRLQEGEDAKILFSQMQVGTKLYDLTVDEDHSFCIEGLFAHNSNCKCYVKFRKARGGIPRRVFP